MSFLVRRSIFLLLCAGLLIVSALPTDQRWVVRRQTTDDIEDTDQDEAHDEPTSTHIPKTKILSMDVESEVQLRYASTKVTSRVTNPAKVAQETTFHIVLPETAFISGFSIEVDGKIYKASVKEKEKAQEEYQGAVNAGQWAAQVTSNARDANQFTVSVNIEPQAKMNFVLTYEELLSRRRGIYEHAIYVKPRSVVPKLSIRVNIHEVLPIKDVRVPAIRNNDVHEADESKNEIAKIIRVNETYVSVVYEPSVAEQKKSSKDGLQGQFVVQYDVDRTSVDVKGKGGEIHVVDGYFVHFFAPSTLTVLPKHVVFILDTSGSMAGIKLEQTKQAMVSILDQLRSEDIFSVVEFSSEVKEWNLLKEYESPEPPYHWNNPELTSAKPFVEEITQTSFGKYDDIFAYPVTTASIKRAKEFVNKMEATGATNINGAVLTALNNTYAVQKKIQLTPLIIFLTDGEPTQGETNLDSILSNIRRGNSDGVVSVFSLAFGSGADYSFLTKVSAQNKGFARKIYEASDATLQLKGFFDEVASPLLKDVRFIYENDKVKEVTESKVANYFSGSEFVIAGKFVEGPSLSGEIAAVSVEGVFIDKFSYSIFPSDILPPFLPKPPIEKPKKEVQKYSLEKIWAYMTIKDLLKKREEDVKDSSNATEKALKLSLQYGFVTPLTSLVVVKPDAADSTTDVRPADGSVAGPQAASFGSPQNIAYRPPPFLAAVAAAAPDFAAFAPGSGIAASPGNYPVPVVAGSAGPDYFEAESASYPPPEDSAPFLPPVAETLPPVSSSSPPLITQETWIDQFQHNDTHASVVIDNETLSLSWEDKLPDEEYYSCNLPSINGTASCKSIWKCSSAFNGGSDSVPDASLVCVIDNEYLGICCAPTPSTTTVTSSPEVEASSPSSVKVPSTTATPPTTSAATEVTSSEVPPTTSSLSAVKLPVVHSSWGTKETPSI